MKRLAIIIIVAAVIVLAVIYFKPLPTAGTANLTISNFAFSEASTGPVDCDVKIGNKIIFEGPVTKPTPCNGLAANYTINGSIVRIDITTTPFKGFCAQVLQDTYYKGSFDLLQSATVQIYYGGEKICDKTVSITGSDKEQACINSGGAVTTRLCCLDTEDFTFDPLCFCNNKPNVETKTCACGTGKVWDGSTCIQIKLIKMNETAKNDCVDSGGTIEVSTSVGGIPTSVEICQCGETKYKNGTKCVSR